MAYKRHVPGSPCCSTCTFWSYEEEPGSEDDNGWGSCDHKSAKGAAMLVPWNFHCLHFEAPTPEVKP